MPTTDPHLTPQQAPSPRRIVLQMEDLSARFAEIARPFVKTALESEVMDAGADAWKEEGERALRSLLRDDSIFDSEGPPAGELINSLKDELENPMPPDEDEIREHSAEVGSVMASSWLQFLALALRTKDELRLGHTLLPQPGEVGDELWEALRGSLNPLAIGVDEAPAIVRVFADEVVADSAGVDLPMGVALDIDRGRQHSYVARRQ